MSHTKQHRPNLPKSLYTFYQTHPESAHPCSIGACPLFSQIFFHTISISYVGSHLTWPCSTLHKAESQVQHQVRGIHQRKGANCAPRVRQGTGQLVGVDRHYAQRWHPRPGGRQRAADRTTHYLGDFLPCSNPKTLESWAVVSGTARRLVPSTAGNQTKASALAQSGLWRVRERPLTNGAQQVIGYQTWQGGVQPDRAACNGPAGRRGTNSRLVSSADTMPPIAAG